MTFDLARRMAEIARNQHWEVDAKIQTAAQKHEAQRKAGDLAAAIEVFQWATADLTQRDLLSAIIATLEARPDLTREDLEALERHIGRLAVVAGGHRLVARVREAGL